MPRSPRPWFRFYSEATESLKVHELPDRFVKPWLFMLCLANANEPRGRLPSISKVAFALRVKEDKAKALIAGLVDRRFIDYDGKHYVMHQWDDFQRDRDVSPTLRDGESRINHANVTPTVSENHAKPSRARARVEESREEERKEAEVDGELAIRRNVYKLFEQSFRRLFSQTEAELLRDLEDTYPEDVVEYAFREAVALNKLSLRYIDSVCKSHKDGVKPDERPPTNGNGRAVQRADDARQPTGAELAVLGRLGLLDPPKRVSVGADVVEESYSEHPAGVEVGVEAG